jgi:hypothetical protein
MGFEYRVCLRSGIQSSFIQVWDVLDDQAACDIVVNEPVLKRKAERLVGHSLKVRAEWFIFFIDFDFLFMDTGREYG